MPRLDPACPEAQRLHRLRASQRALLLDGAEPSAKLTVMVEESYARAAGAHIATCPACRAYLPLCPACSCALEGGRHGWMCPRQASRWRDLLPWNWRPKVGTVPARPPAGPAPGPGPAPGTATVPVAQPLRIRNAPTPTPAPAPPPDPRQRARAILGVKAGIAEDELRRAYREKAMQYHPDKVASLAPEFRAVAERKMREINEAYELLSP